MQVCGGVGGTNGATADHKDGGGTKLTVMGDEVPGWIEARRAISWEYVKGAEGGSLLLSEVPSGRGVALMLGGATAGRGASPPSSAAAWAMTKKSSEATSGTTVGEGAGGGAGAAGDGDGAGAGEPGTGDGGRMGDVGGATMGGG